MTYRLRIGHTLNPAEVLPNTNFSTAAGADWDEQVGVNGVATVQYAAGVGGYLKTTDSAAGGCWAEFVTVQNVLQKNTKYHVTVIVDSATVTYGEDNIVDYAYLECFIGNISISLSQIYIVTQAAQKVYEFDMWCQEESKFAIRFCAFSDGTVGTSNECVISQVSVKAYEWNDASAFMPNTDDWTLNIQSSELFYNFTTSFQEKIILYGDAFTYILNQGFGKAIDVKIESDDSGSWQMFKHGQIMTNDAKFTSESVEVTIDDIVGNFMTEKLSAEINIKMHFNNALSFRYIIRHRTAPAMFQMNAHDPSSGIYAYTDLNVYDIWRVFRDMINELSQGLIVFESSTFLASNGVWWEKLAIGFGDGIGVPFPAFEDLTIRTSFKNIYDNLNKIIAIGSYVYYSDGFKFKMEPISTILSETPINYSHINNISFNYNTIATSSSVIIGYEQNENIYKKGSFTYRSLDADYSSVGGELNLVSNYIRHTAIISDLFTSYTSSVGAYYYIFEWKLDGGIRKTIDFGVIDGFTHGYNGDILPEDNMGRQLALLAGQFKDENNTTTLTGSMPYIKEYQFEMYVSSDDINTLLTNPYTRFNLIDSYYTTIGLIMSLSWNLRTHMATIKLLGT